VRHREADLMEGNLQPLNMRMQLWSSHFCCFSLDDLADIPNNIGPELPGCPLDRMSGSPNVVTVCPGNGGPKIEDPSSGILPKRFQKFAEEICFVLN